MANNAILLNPKVEMRPMSGLPLPVVYRIPIRGPIAHEQAVYGVRPIPAEILERTRTALPNLASNAIQVRVEFTRNELIWINAHRDHLVIKD